MQISVTRGLAELKLLASRIEKEINSTKFVVAHKKSAKQVDMVNTPDEFRNNAKSSFASINDLIERRKMIKSAIVESNASTIVNIAGKEMTVASAIERKDSIEFEQHLLNEMRTQYINQLELARRNNTMVQSKVDDLLLATFGKENKSKISEGEIEAVSKPYLEQYEFVVLDPLELDKKIKELDNDIQSFLSEVDFVLSESNTLTKIEV